MRSKRVFLVGCLMIGLPAALLSQVSAESRLQRTGEIRETTRRILSDAEFEHFQRLYPDKQDAARADSETDGAAANPPGSGSGDVSPSENGSSSQSDSNRSGARVDDTSTDTDSSGFVPVIGRTLSGIFGPLFHVLAWISLFVICALIAFLIFKAIMNYEMSPKAGGILREQFHDTEETDDMSPGDLPSDVYVTRAKELAGQGRYHSAIGELVLGAMSQIERRGMLHYQRGLTHRDYLRAVRNKERQYRALGGMIRIYEPIGFGRREANRENYESTLTGYLVGFENAG